MSETGCENTGWVESQDPDGDFMQWATELAFWPESRRVPPLLEGRGPSPGHFAFGCEEAMVRFEEQRAQHQKGLPSEDSF